MGCPLNDSFHEPSIPAFIVKTHFIALSTTQCLGKAVGNPRVAATGYVESDDRDAQDIIAAQMEEFFFGKGAQLPPGYVPPQKKA